MKHPAAALAALTALAASSFTLAGATPADADTPGECYGHVVTIQGTTRDDVIHGTPGPDVIVGLEGDDTIDGRGGFDLICGGPGRDRISGGSGGDHLLGGGGRDAIRGGGGSDFLMGNGGRNRIFGDAGRDTVLAQGKNVVYGGAGRDSIIRFDSNDRVYAGPGEDHLFGTVRLGKEQVIDGGVSANYLHVEVRHPESAPQRAWKHVTIDLQARRIAAAGHVQKLVGLFTTLYIDDATGARRWTVNGTRYDDWIAMDDSVHINVPVTENGRAGNDNLVGGHGDDHLNGGPGEDLAWAAFGDDTCTSIEGVMFGGDDTSCEMTP